MEEGDARQEDPTRTSRSAVTPTFDWFVRFLSFEVLIAPWLIRILYVVFSFFAVLWLVEITNIRAGGWGRGRYGAGFLGWLLSGFTGTLIWLLITLALIRLIAEALIVLFRGADDLAACRRSLQSPGDVPSREPGQGSLDSSARTPRAALPLSVVGFFGAALFSIVALFMPGYVHERNPRVVFGMMNEGTGFLMLIVSVAGMILALRWGKDRRETWLPGALRATVYINFFLALLFGATAGQSGFDIDLRIGWYLFVALQVLAWLALRVAVAQTDPRPANIGEESPHAPSQE